eukprot:TRINITY_DN2201_c0_g2_i2.p1 TRINITY_DN2201_c0_g2~~TRINITY_DN2201_c0_g2_i2.p1  ORF type:complete len:528 (-),score=137.80 TRINITY_DN2201_c0_g2_i2:708-2291(-)
MSTTTVPDIILTGKKLNTPVDPSPGKTCQFGMCPYDDGVFIFGGCWVSDRFNDLWFFSRNENKWRLMPTKDDFKPSRRNASIMQVIQDVIYIYAGWDYDKTYHEDSWLYDLKNECYLEDPKQYFSSHSSHPGQVIYGSMNKHDDKLYQFGGCSPSKLLNTVWVFQEFPDELEGSIDSEMEEKQKRGYSDGQLLGASNAKEVDETKPRFIQGGKKWGWHEIYNKGSLTPRGRNVHSSNIVVNKFGCLDEHTDGHMSLAVYGGQLAQNSYCDKLYLFDLVDQVWKEIDATTGNDNAPGKIAYHASVFHGTNLFVFGGTDDFAQRPWGGDKQHEWVYCYNFLLKEWSKIQITMESPNKGFPYLMFQPLEVQNLNHIYAYCKTKNDGNLDCYDITLPLVEYLEWDIDTHHQFSKGFRKQVFEMLLYYEADELIFDVERDGFIDLGEKEKLEQGDSFYHHHMNEDIEESVRKAVFAFNSLPWEIMVRIFDHLGRYDVHGRMISTNGDELYFYDDVEKAEDTGLFSSIKKLFK